MKPRPVDRRTMRDDLIARAEQLAGVPAPGDRSEAACNRWLREASALVGAAVHGHAPPGPSPELLDLWMDVAREEFACRMSLFTGVQSALAQLRETRGLDTVFERGLRLVCEEFGFERSILFRVNGSELLAERVHFPGDPALGESFLAHARAHPPRLTHLLLETEMIRKRSAVLVTDAINDPRTNTDLVTAGRTRSYVAAPLLPEGKVIGFLHADRGDSGQTVDELDRDVLHAFAEGFGYAIERTILVERLAAQREQFRRMLRTTEGIVDGFADAELQLARLDVEGARATGDAVVHAADDPDEERLLELLTRRELAVLRLLAEGRTNSAIADELVVSPATVKSHVQHILRKLRASNRAEAASRYTTLRSRPARAAGA